MGTAKTRTKGSVPRRKRRPGLFACIGLDMTDHPKALAAGDAMGTWTWMVLYSRKVELDGFVPGEALRLAWRGEEAARRDVAVLLEVGLVETTDGGWRVLRYEEWNETREEIASRREATRTRVRKCREQQKKPGSGVTRYERVTNALRNAFVPDSDSDSPSVVDRIELSDDQTDQPAESTHARAREGQAAGEAPPAPATAPPSVEDGPGAPIAPGPDPEGGPDEIPPSTGRPEGYPQPRPEPPAWPRPYHVRRAEQGFTVAAFVAGVREATGQPYVVPRDELAALDDAVDGYLPEELRDPYRSSERDAWTTSSVAAFRRAIEGLERLWAGGGPRGWLRWLGAGAPSAEELRMTPAELEAHRAELARRARAAEREREERERERRERAEVEAQSREEYLARAAALARGDWIVPSAELRGVPGS